MIKRYSTTTKNIIYLIGVIIFVVILNYDFIQQSLTTNQFQQQQYKNSSNNNSSSNVLMVNPNMRMRKKKENDKILTTNETTKTTTRSFDTSTTNDNNNENNNKTLIINDEKQQQQKKNNAILVTKTEQNNKSNNDNTTRNPPTSNTTTGSITAIAGNANTTSSTTNANSSITTTTTSTTNTTTSTIIITATNSSRSNSSGNKYNSSDDDDDDDDDNTNNNPTIHIRRKKLKKKLIRFYHIGKAGGGTFQARTKLFWKLNFYQCHPKPCNEFLPITPTKQQLQTNNTNSKRITTSLTPDSNNVTIEANNDTSLLGHTVVSTTKNVTNIANDNNDMIDNKKYVIITLRDPIDRFISAFNWRTLLACRENDTRKRGGNAIGNPEKFCKPIKDRERTVLLDIYQRNYNNLAESICNNNYTTNISTTTTTTTQANDAKNHIKSILHLGHSIHKGWLSTSLIDEYSNFIYPIILEKGYNYEKQIDNSVIWVQNHVQFDKSNKVFELRKQNVYKHNDNDNKMKRKQHTSTTLTKFDNRSNTTTNNNTIHNETQHSSSLTALGESCLLQYYMKDYKILQVVQEKVCKSKDCIQAIQSILDRRFTKSRFIQRLQTTIIK